MDIVDLVEAMEDRLRREREAVQLAERDRTAAEAQVADLKAQQEHGAQSRRIARTGSPLNMTLAEVDQARMDTSHVPKALLGMLTIDDSMPNLTLGRTPLGQDLQLC